MKAAEDSFDTYERWKLDFSSVGKMRGVGWAMCYVTPHNGRLSNHWISLHENGNIAGFIPVLVMDVWEHAYLLDYKPSERASYIEAFFRTSIENQWTSGYSSASRPLVKQREDEREHLGPAE